MFDSLKFKFLVFVGATFLIISLIFLVYGVIKKSSKLKKIAVGFGIIPISCFALIIYWYANLVPIIDNNKNYTYAGIYELENYNKKLKNSNSKLYLYSNGTYKFEGKDIITFGENGTWNTGGTDGYFEFYDSKEKLIELVFPLGEIGNEKLVLNLYESNEIRFIKLNND